MDWAEIEAITYSEEDHPKAVLGAHPVRGGQTLVTAYIPDAKEVSVIIKGLKAPVKMELADEDGYFAALCKNKEPFDYELKVTYKDDTTKAVRDPYSFPDSITNREILKLNSGINYRAYEILGAHPMTIEGVSGVRFAVWAPNAMRVSVVGDFNDWDGRLLQMEKLFDSGVFELFVPDIKAGAKYKYEMKLHSGQTFMKADPYALLSEEKEDGASIVVDPDSYVINDDKWLESRGRLQADNKPVIIYDARNAALTKEAAKELSETVINEGYTHVLVESFEDDIYIPSKDPSELIGFVETMHRKEIAVIFYWKMATFDTAKLGLYDGTPVFEDSDDMRSYVPGQNRKYFNLGRNEVRNYLIANAIYLLDLFHFDALMLGDIPRMLYLDYGKQNSGWTPNMYGGNENLDAIDFIKQLNSVIHKYSSDVLTISDDDTAFHDITGSIDDNGLGFDYKINHGWLRDMTGYLRYDPLSRSGHYNELCFPMIYQYNERFIQPMSDIRDIWKDMPGDRDEKFGNIKALLAFYMVYPGKKLIKFDFKDSKDKDIQGVCDLFRDASALYRKNESFFSKELSYEGFEWINNISARENIIVFTRKGSKKDDDLVVVVNFENVPRKQYKIGVPKPGKYTEIFNSDDEKYDGFGFINKTPINSSKDECDGRNDSIRIKVAPLSVAVFRYNASRSNS